MNASWRLEEIRSTPGPLALKYHGVLCLVRIPVRIHTNNIHIYIPILQIEQEVTSNVNANFCAIKTCIRTLRLKGRGYENS